MMARSVVARKKKCRVLESPNRRGQEASKRCATPHGAKTKLISFASSVRACVSVGTNPTTQHVRNCVCVCLLCVNICTHVVVVVVVVDAIAIAVEHKNKLYFSSSSQRRQVCNSYSYSREG